MSGTVTSFGFVLNLYFRSPSDSKYTMEYYTVIANKHTHTHYTHLPRTKACNARADQIATMYRLVCLLAYDGRKLDQQIQVVRFSFLPFVDHLDFAERQSVQPIDLRHLAVSVLFRQLGQPLHLVGRRVFAFAGRRGLCVAVRLDVDPNAQIEVSLRSGREQCSVYAIVCAPRFQRHRTTF